MPIPEDDFCGMLHKEEKFDIDLRGIEVSGWLESLPAGIYNAYVSEIRFERSRFGTPIITVAFSIDEPGCIGKLVWEHFPVTNDIAKKRLKRMLRVVTGKEFSRFTQDDIPQIEFKPLRLKLWTDMQRDEKDRGCSRIEDFLEVENK